MTSVELLELVKGWVLTKNLNGDSLAKALETVSKTQEVEYFHALHSRQHDAQQAMQHNALDNLIRGNFSGGSEGGDLN